MPSQHVHHPHLNRHPPELGSLKYNPYWRSRPFDDDFYDFSLLSPPLPLNHITCLLRHHISSWLSLSQLHHARNGSNIRSYCGPPSSFGNSKRTQLERYARRRHSQDYRRGDLWPNFRRIIQHIQREPGKLVVGTHQDLKHGPNYSGPNYWRNIMVVDLPSLCRQ